MPKPGIILVLVALAGSAIAQDRGPGRGHGERFGIDADGPPGAPRILGAMPGRPARVVTKAPFSADTVTETTQTLSDGNRIRPTGTGRIYRDSEGRVRNEQTLVGLGALTPNAAPQQVVFINDPVAGLNYGLNPKEKTATKSTFARRDGPGSQPSGRRGAGAPDSARRPDGPRGREAAQRNVKSESLGKQTIDGVQAEGTRTTFTIRAGQIGNEQPLQIVTESWFSPDLQMVVLSKHSDPQSGERVYRLANIVRNEPPATLFQPPSDYKMVEGRGR
jgi:hypothetical protein